jgi:hypothetical protein
MSQASKYITLGTQYTDSSNYKNYDTVIYSNNTGIADEIIAEKIKPFIDEFIEIVPEYYDIPSISPVSNEFLNHEGEDHPFQKICSIAFNNDDLLRYGVEEDIKHLLNLIDNPHLVKLKQDEARKEAITSLTKQLQELNPDETTKVIVTVKNGMVVSIGGNTSKIKIIILDYDKQADDPIIISEQLEPNYTFQNGEAWLHWDGKSTSKEDKQVKRQLKKLKF